MIINLKQQLFLYKTYRFNQRHCSWLRTRMNKQQQQGINNGLKDNWNKSNRKRKLPMIHNKLHKFTINRFLLIINSDTITRNLQYQILKGMSVPSQEVRHSYQKTRFSTSPETQHLSLITLVLADQYCLKIHDYKGILLRYCRQTGLQITAGQRTMSGQNWLLTGQILGLPDILSGPLPIRSEKF